MKISLNEEVARRLEAGIFDPTPEFPKNRIAQLMKGRCRQAGNIIIQE